MNWFRKNNIETHYAIPFKNEQTAYVQRIRQFNAGDKPMADHEIIIVEQYQEVLSLKEEIKTLKLEIGKLKDMLHYD